MSLEKALSAQLLSQGWGKRGSVSEGEACMSSDELELLHIILREGNHFLDVSYGKFYLTEQELIALKPGAYPRIHTGVIKAERKVCPGVWHHGWCRETL